MRFVTVLVAMLVSATPGCSTRPNPPASTEAQRSVSHALVVGKGPRAAIVTLEPTSPREFPPITVPAGIDQFGQAFSTELLIIRGGQPVHFTNSENELHNVRIDERATKKSVWNVVMAPGVGLAHVFDNPGFYNVSCDFHQGMKMEIFVATTPYAALADEDGRFTFSDVEPGSYRMTAFGNGEPLERVVNVAAPRTELNIEETNARP